MSDPSVLPRQTSHRCAGQGGRTPGEPATRQRAAAQHAKFWLVCCLILHKSCPVLVPDPIKSVLPNNLLVHHTSSNSGERHTCLIMGTLVGYINSTLSQGHCRESLPREKAKIRKGIAILCAVLR